MNQHRENKTVEAVMRKNGIVYPVATRKNAERTGLNLGLACSVLVQETGGGHNVFGHDPVRSPQIIGGTVTHSRYQRYKELRKKGYGMQGVGPMQLTWYEFQDHADSLGGCDKPKINIFVGFSYLAANIRAYGKSAGIARYNGTGPAAVAYSVQVRTRARWFNWKFKLALKKAERKNR